MKMTKLSWLATASLLTCSPILLSNGQSQGPASAGQNWPANAVTGQSSASAAAAGDLISSVQLLANGKTQIIVLDAGIRTLASYHVDEKGAIQLMSVRQIGPDLRLDEFNATKPTPSDVRNVTQPGSQP